MPKGNILTEFMSNFKKVKENKRNKETAKQLERMRPGSQPKELLK